MRRLLRSSKILMMEVPFSVEQLVDATKETIRTNKLEAGYIRPLVYYGYGGMGLNPLNNPVHVAIAAWPWGTYLGDEGLAHGIRVKITSWDRIDANAYPPQMKSTGGYLNSILAKLEVLKAGYEEALFLTPNGYVAEGPGESFFIVRDGTILTPPLTSAGLDSLTRHSVITIARDLGYEVFETELVRSDVYLADEAFFTGTAAELTPIREIDDRTIGEPGPITKKLQETFFAATRGEVETYREWNEYV
jgi:branched-chain amino acid aminotransferase